jgi:2-hydroxychromene-2-carboxylate isomerase
MPALKVVDYYFAPTSPFSYLGHDRLLKIARRREATISVKPIDLGRVFAVSGGLPLKQRAPQRQAYRLSELGRWSEYLNVPINAQPKFFPVAADPAAKLILAAAERGRDEAMSMAGALLRAVWVEERNIADLDTLAAIAREQGADPAMLAQRAESQDIAARYDALTQEAIDRQVFGAPTYVYGEELFWGQDRLDFLDLALAK